MKLLQRVMTLIRANINDMLEQSEDPEQLLRQLQQDLRNQMMQVKTQVATAIAQEHKLQSRCEELTKDAAEWQHKAEAAVAHGDDAQARRALQQRLDTMRLLENYRRQHEEQQHLIVTMRNALKQLQAKTEETELNIELLQMRRRRAQMQQTVFETLSKNRQEQTQERVRRAEDKVMDDEARAAATRDDAQRNTLNTLDTQLTHLSQHEMVEEQLSRIKTRHQKPAQPRQLPHPGAAKGAALRQPPSAPAQPAEAQANASPPALPSGERLPSMLPPLNEQIDELLKERQAKLGTGPEAEPPSEARLDNHDKHHTSKA
ncbi:MAG TPA: PspA/IM30 family protein [Ktedonobacterales bacterium]|nr:PspA/IM30 family protein [Ktedonobacterales bacterium]